jgi:hypothetical protein
MKLRLFLVINILIIINKYYSVNTDTQVYMLDPSPLVSTNPMIGRRCWACCVLKMPHITSHYNKTLCETQQEEKQEQSMKLKTESGAEGDEAKLIKSDENLNKDDTTPDLNSESQTKSTTKDKHEVTQEQKVVTQV